MVEISIDKDWKIVFNGYGVWELVKARRDGNGNIRVNASTRREEWQFVSNSKSLSVMLYAMFRHRVKASPEVIMKIEDISALFEHTLDELTKAVKAADVPVAVFAENEQLKERVRCLQERIDRMKAGQDAQA